MARLRVHGHCGDIDVGVSWARLEPVHGGQLELNVMEALLDVQWVLMLSLWHRHVGLLQDTDRDHEVPSVWELTCRCAGQVQIRLIGHGSRICDPRDLAATICAALDGASLA